MEKLVVGKATMFETLLGFIPQYEKELNKLFESNGLDKDFIKPNPIMRARRVGWTSYTLLCMSLGFLFKDDFDKIEFSSEFDGLDSEKRLMFYCCYTRKEATQTCKRFKGLLINYFGEETFNKYFEVTSNSITKIKTKGEK